MSVIGIDLGSVASKIGVARHRGIDILTNEVSNRATPSLVSFGVKQRAIGESAKTQEVSNFKNTIGSLKRLVGRSLSDPEIQDIETKFLTAKLVDVQGTAGVQVNYIGEQQTFSATQLVAMYLGKLRDIASNEIKAGVSDVVIAIPAWFNETQRRAILDAAQIAGLHCLRLMNDTTAVALGYGITKSDLPAEEETPRHVVFVDVGHSNMSVSVVAYSKGRLSMKATAFNRNLGGRDIDQALVQHFAEEFKGKYKIDVMSKPKAVFRLAAGCEKLKKVLSANAEAPLNVESIMTDIDASSRLKRDAYETLISHVLDGIVGPINEAIAESGLSVDQIDAIELVGGSTRIPAVRQRINSCFPDKNLSNTLNQEEAIARGATFACAILSPVFRVRDFSVIDINHYPIKVQWAKIPEDDDSELVVFPRGNVVPSAKILTFYRKEPFELEALYADPSSTPGVNPWIARLTCKQVPPSTDGNGEAIAVKVKVKLGLHGTFSFEQVYYEEVEEKEDTSNMDVEGDAKSKKKRIIKKKDLPFIVGTSSLDATVINTLRESENAMHAADKLITDTEDRKNALEEYIYDMRSKLDSRYVSFVQAKEKETLLLGLKESETWLYSDEGEDATKSAYVSRLDALKKVGDPITARYRESEGRVAAASQLRETINQYMTQALSEDEKYSHIDAAQKQSVVEKAATAQKWLEDQLVRQSERPKNTDVVITCDEILKKKEELIYFAVPIMTKPKPKVASTPNGAGTETPKSRTDTPAPAGGEEKDAQVPLEMDID